MEGEQKIYEKLEDFGEAGGQGYASSIKLVYVNVEIFVDLRRRYTIETSWVQSKIKRFF